MPVQHGDKESVIEDSMEKISSEAESGESIKTEDITKDEGLDEIKETGEELKTEQDVVIEDSSEIKPKPELKGEQIEDKVIVFDVNKESNDTDLVSETVISIKDSEVQEDQEEVNDTEVNKMVGDEIQGESLPEGGEDLPQEKLKVDSATQDESEREPERKESATQEG